MTTLPGALVDAAWLASALVPGRDDLVVADVRWYLDGRRGRDAYDAGHIPGAVFVDLDTELSGPPGPGTGRHPLPTPGDFLVGLARHGIGPGTLVVAYDDAGGSIAARLWWMLHVLGRPAAVLDGGLAAWTGSLASGPSTAPGGRGGALPVKGAPEAWPAGATAGTDDIETAIAAGAVLLDARTAARYAGAPGSPDAVPGHIPGARSAPWADNVDPASGRLRPVADLVSRYAGLGAVPGVDVVASCGSGVTACHDLLALHLAGIEGRLYAGSWSAWSSDPSRPVATGADQGAA